MLRGMNRWVVLLLGCMLAAASQAQTREIWEWTDANGVRHFSDSPAPGARRVTVAAPTPATPPPATARPATSAAAAASSNQPAAVEYTRLEIWQPENGASFFEPDVTIGVRIRSEPDLARGDRLLTYLDGKLIDGSENATEVTLSGLERGAHSITSVILDSRGNERIRSSPVVFHMKQTTVNGPNPNAQGPGVRPPVRPTPLPAPARPPRG
jgi:hypothetical protein